MELILKVVLQFLEGKNTPTTKSYTSQKIRINRLSYEAIFRSPTWDTAILSNLWCPLFRLNTQTGRLNKKYHLLTDLAFGYQFKTVTLLHNLSITKSFLGFHKMCLLLVYSYQYYFQITMRKMHITNTWQTISTWWGRREWKNLWKGIHTRNSRS